jgi:glycerate 2-kinase
MSQIPLEAFLTTSLRVSPWGKQITRILAAALEAVDPSAAIHNHVKRQGDHLDIAGKIYNLAEYRRVILVGGGKAGIPMAQAIVETLGDRLQEGILLVKDTGEKVPTSRSQEIPAHLTLLQASHPVPDQRGVAGTQQIIQLLGTTTPDDLVICLISGGGSALLTAPALGISLADLQALTSTLLACGATINQINTLRKHLSQIKGGQLARLAAPATLVTLILSDVVGDPLDIIASGPTVPDPSTYQDALSILERYNIRDQVPERIFQHLECGAAGEIPETPKPKDPAFERAQNVLVGSNLLAAKAAVKQAQKEGFNALLLTTYLQGEARTIGPILAALARQIDVSGDPLPRPTCLVIGGETTVILRGDGLGGRNQELALSAVNDLAGLSGTLLVTLATDGEDGPTDAAGAVVTGETLDRAQALGLSLLDHLNRNDSYQFFRPLDDLLLPGPTGTNVNDLTFVFVY